MGCLQHIYLQLFKHLCGELQPVQTTQACPSEEQDSGLLRDMMKELVNENSTGEAAFR